MADEKLTIFVLMVVEEQTLCVLMADEERTVCMLMADEERTLCVLMADEERPSAETGVCNVLNMLMTNRKRTLTMMC